MISSFRKLRLGSSKVVRHLTPTDAFEDLEKTLHFEKQACVAVELDADTSDPSTHQQNKWMLGFALNVLWPCTTLLYEDCSNKFQKRGKKLTRIRQKLLPACVTPGLSVKVSVWTAVFVYWQLTRSILSLSFWPALLDMTWLRFDYIPVLGQRNLEAMHNPDASDREIVLQDRLDHWRWGDILEGWMLSCTTHKKGVWRMPIN